MRALVLGEDPHQCPPLAFPLPFCSRGLCRHAERCFQNFKTKFYCDFFCTLSRGRLEPRMSALLGLSGPCRRRGESQHPGGPRRPHSLGTHVRGSCACRLHFSVTEIRVGKTGFPSRLGKCRCGDRLGVCSWRLRGQRWWMSLSPGVQCVLNKETCNSGGLCFLRKLVA